MAKLYFYYASMNAGKSTTLLQAEFNYRERGKAVVPKLGAKREGLLRQDRVTWTGFLRSTCVFGLLREDWAE